MKNLAVKMKSRELEFVSPPKDAETVALEKWIAREEPMLGAMYAIATELARQDKIVWCDISELKEVKSEVQFALPAPKSNRKD